MKTHPRTKWQDGRNLLIEQIDEIPPPSRQNGAMRKDLLNVYSAGRRSTLTQYDEMMNEKMSQQHEAWLQVWRTQTWEVDNDP